MAGLALLSGGLDSTVAAALHARAEGLDAALFVDYGQRAADPERRAARAVAAALGVPLDETTSPLLADLCRNHGLAGASGDLPEPADADLDDAAASAASAAAVWVPNRNGLLLSMAAAVAESRGVATVIAGFNAEEAASFPDNGPAFLEAFNASLAFSTRLGVRVVSPTIAMTKAELVTAGRGIEAPIDRSWSCYRAGPEPCGRCESCRRRRRALGG